jgi:hypothetical protein
MVWGRADDFQTAFGLLADFRGDHELAEELLATPITHQALLATVVIEHVARMRGRHGEAGWRKTALELLTRVLPDDTGGGRGGAGVTPELVSWWASGRVDEVVGGPAGDS